LIYLKQSAIEADCRIRADEVVEWALLAHLRHAAMSASAPLSEAKQTSI
jgi:hypothetical protein